LVNSHGKVYLKTTHLLYSSGNRLGSVRLTFLKECQQGCIYLIKNYSVIVKLLVLQFEITVFYF